MWGRDRRAKVPAMEPTTLTCRAVATAGALVTAAALAVTGVLQIVDEQSSESTTHGTVEHVMLALFTVTLLAQVPALLRLGELAGRVPSLIASAGSVVLGLLGTVSNVRGEDPSFFAAVAAPANLVWFAGLVALAVVLFRRGAVARPVAVVLPFTYLCTIPLAQLGAGLLGAVLWIVVVRLALSAEAAPVRRLQAA